MFEPRLCEVCSSDIPKWKSKGTTVCSVGCRFKRKDQRRQKARAELKEKRKTTQRDFIIFHNCIYYGGIDPFVPERCRCRKTVSEETARSLVARGEAVDLQSRLPIFEVGQAIVQVGKVLRTPRVPTLEVAHFERITQKPKQAAKTKEPTIEQLKALVDEQCAERYQEETVRMEIYGELSQAFICSLIRKVPADEYDKQKREQTGISILSHFQDERGSVGRDVPSISFDYEKDIEEQNEDRQAEPSDEELETETEVEDERSAEEVLAEFEESNTK
jgi:hypothetical protein